LSHDEQGRLRVEGGSRRKAGEACGGDGVMRSREPFDVFFFSRKIQGRAEEWVSNNQSLKGRRR